MSSAVTEIAVIQWRCVTSVQVAFRVLVPASLQVRALSPDEATQSPEGSHWDLLSPFIATQWQWTSWETWPPSVPVPCGLTVPRHAHHQWPEPVGGVPAPHNFLVVCPRERNWKWFLFSGPPRQAKPQGLRKLTLRPSGHCLTLLILAARRGGPRQQCWHETHPPPPPCARRIHWPEKQAPPAGPSAFPRPLSVTGQHTPLLPGQGGGVRTGR